MMRVSRASGRLRAANASVIVVRVGRRLRDRLAGRGAVVPDVVGLADDGVEPKAHEDNPRESGLTGADGGLLGAAPALGACIGFGEAGQPGAKRIGDGNGSDGLEALHPAL